MICDPSAQPKQPSSALPGQPTLGRTPSRRRRFLASRRPRATLAALAVVLGLLASLALAATASADTVTLRADTGLPWTDPQHQSPLEVLGSQIASRIAGKPVGVRCEGLTDWGKLTTERGIDPSSELGYVGVSIYSRGSEITSVVTSPFAELSTSVCQSLQTFALAESKPTKCPRTETVKELQTKPQRVLAQVKIDLGPDAKRPGKRRTLVRSAWKTQLVTTQVSVARTSAPAPCYTGGLTGAGPDGTTAEQRSYWLQYQSFAEAILTLAHESIHLGGMVGGATTGGLLYGDQQAEAKAECYGMQWMTYVATQLGATPDDALAIAQYEYRWLYPERQGDVYWSADCIPGGALDIRTDKTAAWPSGLS